MFIETKMTSRQESIEDNGTTHIMLKTSTIYSSLNSIYNNKDFPLKVMKIFTSAILVAMTIAILTVTSNIYHSKSSKTSDCIKLSSLGLDVDQSKNLTCQYQKKIPENGNLSLCINKYNIVVIISNLKSTISQRQWEYMKRLIPYIDNNINKIMT